MTHMFYKKINSYCLLLIILSIGFHSGAFSNEKKTIDSLKISLKTNVDDTEKMASKYKQLAHAYAQEGELQEALEFYKKALKIREEFRDFISVSDWDHYMDLYYFNQKYPRLLDFSPSDIKTKEERIKYAESAVCYNIIAGVYKWLGKNKQALESHQKALYIKKVLGDRFGMADCYNIIGYTYAEQGNFKKALDNYYKELEIREGSGDRNDVINCYNSLREIYLKKSDLILAEKFNKRALQVSEEIGNISGIADAYNAYGDIDKKSEKNTEAIDYYKKALKLYKEEGNEIEIIIVLHKISDSYLNLNNDIKAIEYAELSLEIAERTGFFPMQKDIYKTLSKAYDDLGNAKEALKYYKLVSSVNDSLFNDEKIRKLSKMDSIYQSEKNQKEIELKESLLAKKEVEIKQQKTLNFSFMGGLALVMIFSGVVLFLLRKSGSQNTQLKLTNLKLQKTTAELIESEKKSFISDMVAGLAHDLKTPVGNAMLSSDTIRNEGREIEKLMQNKALTHSRLENFNKKVHESGDLIYTEMLRISEWIKGFQSINADQVRVDSQNIYLKEYLATCMKTLDFKLKSKKITYSISGPDELVVNVLPGFISQIVINLINNAVEHGFEGVNNTEKHIHLNIEKNELNKMIVCECTNNGRPIPPEILSKIFDEYFSTKNGIKGMGLSSVKRIIEQGLGGSISCFSNENIGVKFVMEFPQ